MPEKPQASNALRIAIFLGFFTLATLMHIAAGAYSSGFGAFEDEPSHLVTSLMVRDWLASGDYLNPRAYAETYYVHYPKVGIGQWPPVFHGTLGVWMLVVGTSTAAVVAFLTLVTTAIAFVVYSVVRRPLGDAAGVIAGVLFLSVPIVQSCSASAMTEMLIALLALLAVLAFGRFLDSGQSRWVFGFGGLAALTILTKGSGLALALVPPLSIVFGRRFDLLKRPSLWFAAVMVAGLTGPWYFLTVELSQGTWSGGNSPSLSYFEHAARSFAGWLPGLAGLLGLIAVPIGMGWGLKNGALHGQWITLSAWVPSILILHMVVPSSVEERHLAVLAPAWVIFAALGAGVVSRMFAASRSERSQVAAAVGVTILVAALIATSGARPTKHWTGWGETAANLIERGENAPKRLLIASDPVGEGLFVAGVALAETKRPDSIALRASKVLGNAGWSGHDYEPRFASVQEVSDYLDTHGVGIVVFDRSVEGSRHWYQHMRQLEEILGANDGRWIRDDRWDIVRNGARQEGALAAFVRTGWEQLPSPALSLKDVLRK